MAEAILKLTNLTKTYIIGKRKNAHKAQKAIQKLQKQYEHHMNSGNTKQATTTHKTLREAQVLFANEQYEECYQVVTGKPLRLRPRDRGTVVHALRGVNLTIQAGELVAIMGPSGSGKSTLLNMLGLLDQPTSGEILIEGRNVATIKHGQLPDIRSSKLGFVFQSYNLVPSLTALENVMLPLRYAGIRPKQRRKKAKTALELVGLGNRISHSPNELSGGQQQRVAIARSIVNEPAIIFGDELTGELDSAMTTEVMNIITKLNQQGQTFIIVTHNPDVAAACQRVIYMKDGQISHEAKRTKSIIH